MMMSTGYDWVLRTIGQILATATILSVISVVGWSIKRLFGVEIGDDDD